MFGGGGVARHPVGVGGDGSSIGGMNKPEVVFEEGKYVQVRNPNHHESKPLL